MTYVKMAAPPKNVYASFVQGEPKNQSPFTTPVMKSAPTQFQQQVSASLAANPQASGGAYGIVGNPLTSTTTAGAPMGSAASSSGGYSSGVANANYDPTTDPIYQRILSLGQSQVSQAVAGGDALRKQILIQLGDPQFAHQQQFGDPTAPSYGDQSTEDAAGQNPYSTMKQLANSHLNNTANIDQTTNRNGLFYSSTHANQLGQENQNYNAGIANADSSAASQLGNIVQQILAAQNNSQLANIGALGTATQNMINQAIANGYSFGGFDSSGHPILNAPGSSSGGSGATDGGASGQPAANTAPASGGQSGSALNSYIGQQFAAANVSPSSPLGQARQNNGKGAVSF